MLGLSKKQRDFLVNCKRGNFEEVSAALESGMDVNTHDQHGRSALYFACCRSRDPAQDQDRERTVQLLLKTRDIDVNSKIEYNGITVLMHAVTNYNMNILQSLASHPEIEIN